MTRQRKKRDVRPKTKAVNDPSGIIRSGAPVTVNIVRTMPDPEAVFFCDSLVVQKAEDTFVLSFLQTQYPLAVSPEEQATVKEMEQLCVARIILTPMQMARNIYAMDANFTKFLNDSGADVKNFKEFVEKFILPSKPVEIEVNNPV